MEKESFLVSIYKDYVTKCGCRRRVGEMVSQALGSEILQLAQSPQRQLKAGKGLCLSLLGHQRQVTNTSRKQFPYI